ncbi:N-acetylmuramoyl-L-alanine amidase [Clostridium bowmanii]|uniref:N-acetylmuramoyl-L-alanine amidase n=1 Tax=Clostridium bowmanii TaxID=132925 RepID=UPI001C0E88EE|nr:N-acetylmuramoyl-L-alanine amidase [Clostridium bowmanii]MBU3191610.1 N-acetylmuramoyl-L-alanine amidase [Clostridium bowmanii]MCA1075914.1 N-acetylmuramoyl-L-alanine amidase [Clostridium bowmanii]
MKISIDAGHNCIPDGGAIGIKREDSVTKEVVGKIIQKLQNTTTKIVDCTPYGQVFSNVGQSLQYRCNKANQSNSDLHLCIHFNAGGGEGVECYVISQTAKNYAAKICNEIASLGYKNRGVKDGTHLFVVKNTRMPCVLVECAFIDSKKDMTMYNADLIANAIIKAVVGMVIASNSVIASFQAACNLSGVTDKNGNKLVVDGVRSDSTNSVIAKVILKKDTSSNLVKWLQTRLITLGFPCGRSGSDGIFGASTLVAVKNFQVKNKLLVDGIVGPNTLNKLLG